MGRVAIKHVFVSGNVLMDDLGMTAFKQVLVISAPSIVAHAPWQPSTRAVHFFKTLLPVELCSVPPHVSLTHAPSRCSIACARRALRDTLQESLNRRNVYDDVSLMEFDVDSLMVSETC